MGQLRQMVYRPLVSVSQSLLLGRRGRRDDPRPARPAWGAATAKFVLRGTDVTLTVRPSAGAVELAGVGPKQTVRVVVRRAPRSRPPCCASGENQRCGNRRRLCGAQAGGKAKMVCVGTGC